MRARITACILTCFILALATRDASSATVLKFHDVTVTSDPFAPTTHSIDLYFEITGSPPTLGGYNAAILLLDGGASVSLTDVQEALTPHPAVFTGQTPMIASLDAASAQLFDTIDSGQPINHLAGLLRLAFQVEPLVLGQFHLSLNLDETFLFDPDFEEIPFDGSAQGTITVVPEPSAMTLAAVGAALLLSGGMVQRRIKTRRTAG